MMVFLPLGHDRGIFRFPYVTVAIIALCLVVQIYNTVKIVDEETQRQLAEQEKITYHQLFMRHGRAWAERRNPDQTKAPESAEQAKRALLRSNQELRQFIKDFEAGEVVPTSHPDYQRLQELRKTIKGALGLLLTCGYGKGARPYTLVTYMFMHAGWLHLIMNMLFLYLCGCNMEDRWGRVIWLLLYIGGGVAAALTWAGVNPSSEGPLVGASGAIAAAMGAFLVTNYKAEIRIGYFIMVVIRPIWGVWEMKAYWALPLWLLGQLLGLATEGHAGQDVAYSAHVGGFIMGAGVALVMRLIGVDRRLVDASREKATVFSQDPAYLEGLDHLERGDRAAALASFDALLARNPEHLDAAMEVYRLQTEPAQAARAAARALTLAKRAGDQAVPLSIYTDLNQRHPGAPWDDRSLFFIAECYERKPDVSAAVAVYDRLVSLHPQSPLAPKALLKIAGVYAKSFNQKELARRALEQILERFPGTPFADRALELLHGLPAAELELERGGEEPPR